MMRAKMYVTSVTRQQGGSEQLDLSAVCSSEFGPEGESEDNTYARYTPSASLNMTINNPDLAGKFNPGDTFYVDFTPAE
jgi:hypothetical protein